MSIKVFHRLLAVVGWAGLLGIAAATARADHEGFAIEDRAGEHLDVRLDGKIAARYMYAYDKSTPERLAETYKPYLHVFDADGQQPITKGPGGQFTHHRGIFIGWMKIKFQGKSYDRWHMKGGEIVHQKFLDQKADADRASFTSQTYWNDAAGQPFLVEERTMTFRRAAVPVRLIIDFHTKLSAPRGDLTLDGDPEHAGVQYRPANEVDSKLTTYFFPKENANSHKDFDYPWVGETYVLKGKKYSIVDINPPTNPKKTRFSAYRDYGRFGAFPVATIEKGQSLKLDYRFLIADGEMLPTELIQKSWDEFSHAAIPSPMPKVSSIPSEQPAVKPAPRVTPVAAKIAIKAEPFALTQVRLLDGPFRRAQELDHQYLLSLDTDRLLHTFRINAGIPSSAKPLGGWEEPKCELRGHFVGHYLSACALMYASTGDEKLKAKAAAVVAGLAECQAKLGGGYLSAYPESFIDRVEARQKVWAPYYTLHKIYAGLIDAYSLCGNRQALDVCKKFGDWAIARNAKLTDEQMQAMMGNEHGGMNETLANLYGLTGDAKYLAIARRFNHIAVIGPASKREDRLTGLHANTQIPKFIGTAREYELTGEDRFKTASTFFWETVVKERSYVIGGDSDGEMFSPKEKLSQALGPNTTETCNTYNMLKLTRHLFTWDPQPQYADYYERALYNHILCSQNPHTGMMCYYLPLRSGSHKEYNGPLDGFWCCTGTGVENHAKYGESIYFHGGDESLYVNLFIASELDWKAKGIKLRQETEYPEKPSTKLTFTCEKSTACAVLIRHPWWATDRFEIRINGQLTKITGTAGSYAKIERTWANGDTIDISMPFTLYTEGFHDNPKRFAFMHGPLVLAAEVNANRPFPAVVAEEGKAIESLKPVEGKASTFSGPVGIFRAPEATQGVTLEPLYKIHGQRPYVVYFDAFTQEQWKAKGADYQKELEHRKALDARTVDSVNLGEEQNERDHHLKSEESNDGIFNDRKWRDARGWFSWELKVPTDKPADLVATYWGSDGGRAFDVLVDGKLIATQKLSSGGHRGQFFDVVYHIPAELLKGKQSVTIRFEARKDSIAGGVFGCRVMHVK